MALGAGVAEVIGMVMKQSARLAAIGAAVGVGGAMALGPLLANQLALLKPYDWAAYAGGAAAGGGRDPGGLLAAGAPGRGRGPGDGVEMRLSLRSPKPLLHW